MKWLCLLLPAALYAQAPPFEQRVHSVVEAYAHTANPPGDGICQHRRQALAA